MNIVSRFVPTRHITQRRISAWGLLGTLLLVLTLLAGCMPIQQAAANPAANEAITLHLAVSDAEGSPSEPYVREFINQVKTLSNGNITIEPTWDAGNGTPEGFEKGVIQLVMNGKFDLGLAAARAWDAKSSKSFYVLQTPFLITDDALAAAVAGSDVATRMLNNLSPAGVVGLTLWPEDLRHPFSVVLDKPLLSPQDFAGLTIRTSPSDISFQLVDALGAKPTFDDGGYQGAESGLLQGPSLLGKPTATGNVVFFPKFQVLFANKAALAHLSAEQRTVLQQAAASAQKKSFAEHPKEADAASAWCKDGGTIAIASDAQLAEFEQVAAPIIKQIEQDPTNAELLAAIRDLKAHTTPSQGATACAPSAAVAPTATAAIPMVATAAPAASTSGGPMPCIVFVSHPGGNAGANSIHTDVNAEIYIMNADGSDQTRLTNNHKWDNEPSASPDGKRIAFVSDRDGPGQIYAMNVDGSDVIRLTNDKGDDDLPIFSPDGAKITFFSDRDGNSEVYVMNADGSNQTNISNNPELDEFPSWSPDGKKIVFNSTRDSKGGNRDIRNTNGDIYIMNADGSDQTRLTYSGGHNGRPMWSPDGKRILFEVDHYGNAELHVINIDGSGEAIVTNNETSGGAEAWSLDGTQIAFTSTRDGGDLEIYVMNADGSNQTRLTNNPAVDEYPNWSPDGKKIVFNSTRDGSPWITDTNATNGEIYVMNADGSNQTRLTNNPAVDEYPNWSPDGKKIVFNSTRDGSPWITDTNATNGEIYVMNADGSNQTRLTNNPAVDEYPNWSPDGKKIVFNSTRDGSPWITDTNATNGEIYVMNADGSDQFRLTHDGGVDGRPMWSPDGKKILFDTERDGNADIYVMNADGSNETRLTDNLWPDLMPSWSLDGQHITFTAMRDKNDMEIYMMNADGSNQTRLTYNQGDDVWAGWLPGSTAATP